MLVQGLSRIKVKKYIQEEPYFKAEAEMLNDIVEEGLELNALATSVSNQFQKIVSLVPYLSDELQVVVVNLNDPSKLADFVASNLNLRLEQKQDLLETVNIKERLTKLTRTLEKQVQELYYLIATDYSIIKAQEQPLVVCLETVPDLEIKGGRPDDQNRDGIPKLQA